MAEKRLASEAVCAASEEAGSVGDADGTKRTRNKRSKQRKPKGRAKKRERISLEFRPVPDTAPLKLRTLQRAILWLLG